MAIVYAVMTFSKKGRRLVSDQPIPAKSREAAVAMAEKLKARKDGVVAYSQNVDPEVDVYDDPVILASHGDVPEDLA